MANVNFIAAGAFVFDQHSRFYVYTKMKMRGRLGIDTMFKYGATLTVKNDFVYMFDKSYITL